MAPRCPRFEIETFIEGFVPVDSFELNGRWLLVTQGRVYEYRDGAMAPFELGIELEASVRSVEACGGYLFTASASGLVARPFDRAASVVRIWDGSVSDMDVDEACSLVLGSTADSIFATALETTDRLSPGATTTISTAGLAISGFTAEQGGRVFNWLTVFDSRSGEAFETSELDFETGVSAVLRHPDLPIVGTSNGVFLTIDADRVVVDRGSQVRGAEIDPSLGMTTPAIQAIHPLSDGFVYLTRDFVGTWEPTLGHRCAPMASDFELTGSRVTNLGAGRIGVVKRDGLLVLDGGGSR